MADALPAGFKEVGTELPAGFKEVAPTMRPTAPMTPAERLAYATALPGDPRGAKVRSEIETKHGGFEKTQKELDPVAQWAGTHITPALIAAAFTGASGAAAPALGAPAAAGRILGSAVSGAAQAGAEGRNLRSIGWSAVLDSIVAGITEGAGSLVTKLKIPGVTRTVEEAANDPRIRQRAFEWAARAPHEALEFVKDRLPKGKWLNVPSLTKGGVRVTEIEPQPDVVLPNGKVIKGFRLFNLLEDTPGHPAGSTIAEETLKQLNAKAGKLLTTEEVVERLGQMTGPEYEIARREVASELTRLDAQRLTGPKPTAGAIFTKFTAPQRFRPKPATAAERVAQRVVKTAESPAVRTAAEALGTQEVAPGIPVGLLAPLKAKEKFGDVARMVLRSAVP